MQSEQQQQREDIYGHSAGGVQVRRLGWAVTATKIAGQWSALAGNHSESNGVTVASANRQVE